MPPAMGHMELQRVREAKGISRNKLARMTGLAPQTIYTLESLGSTPSLDTARAIADALEVEVDQIFPRDVEPIPEVAR